MKRIIFLWVVAGIANLPTCWAAEPNPDIESLKRELKELRQRTEELERKLERFEKPEAVPPGAPIAAPPVAPTAAAPAPPTSPAPEAGIPSANGTSEKTAVAAPAEVTQPWSPSQPISLFRAGSAYLNLSLSTLIDAGWSSDSDVESIERGGHDPVQRGFSLPNTELALDGAVDPYFKGFANIVFKLDKDNSTEVELEESYLLSTSLPANLQVKAGQFQAEFGRQNAQHPHSWAFVDQPVILNRLFGPDGLRDPGARISWLTPAPFYSELFLTVMNGNGDTAYSFRNQGDTDEFGVRRVHGRATIDRGLRGPGDLLYVPRWANSFDLTDTQTLLLGTSAAFGPNDTGSGLSTQIYGVDGYWKWKSANAVKGFPFVSVQSEAMFRRFEAGSDPTQTPPLPSETLNDWGFYAQVLWGFKPLWIAGLRGEFATGDSAAYDQNDPLRGDRTRISPNLTWFPSEFSKLRLQYNYDEGPDFGTAHSVWLQLEFLLGAHAAHKF